MNDLVICDEEFKPKEVKQTTNCEFWVHVSTTVSLKLMDNIYLFVY